MILKQVSPVQLLLLSSDVQNYLTMYDE